jgi:hypothetical protein
MEITGKHQKNLEGDCGGGSLKKFPVYVGSGAVMLAGK